MAANISEPTPLGTLLKLPPELRDRIYNHVFDQSYIVFWDEYTRNDDVKMSVRSQRPISFADFDEIRCISKTISAEATACLFSNKTNFVYVVSFNQVDERLSSPPDKKTTEKMVNVEFRVQTGASVEAGYIWSGEVGRTRWSSKSSRWANVIPMTTADGAVVERRTLYFPSNVDPRCEGSVDYFTRTAIERNKLQVTFDDFDQHFHLFMPTRFFRTLKKCIGFRSIVVVLEWWGLEGKIPYSMAVAVQVEEVRRELEQCWGPCVVTDARDQSTQSNDHVYHLHFVFELAFQPLKFRGRNAKAGGAEVVEEADRLEEQQY